MGLLLRETRCFSLRAAVTAVDGLALVLMGRRIGKSTLAWALHAQGADCFGDEAAFFTVPDHQLHVMPRDLSLRPDGLRRLPSPPAAHSWFDARPGDPKAAVALPAALAGMPPGAGRAPLPRGVRRRAVAPPHRRRRSGAPRAALHEPTAETRPWASDFIFAADLVTRYDCWSLVVGPPEPTAALLLAAARGRAAA